MKNLYLLFFSLPVLCLMSTSITQAEESVCLRKRARVVNGRINLARAVKRVDGECPKNTVRLDESEVEAASLDNTLDPEFKSLLQNGFVVTNEQFVVFREGESAKGVQANCPESSMLVSGSCTSPDSDVTLLGSGPIYPTQASGGITTWICNYFRSVLPGQAVGRTYTAKAICLTVIED